MKSVKLPSEYFHDAFRQIRLKKRPIINIIMVLDTNPMSVKTCSRCDETKECDKFIKKRNICKTCTNKRALELLKLKPVPAEKCCSICEKTDTPDKFIGHINVCKDCHNKKRTEDYKTNERLREKKREEGRAYKKKKTEIRQAIRQAELDRIGEGNKQCSVCSSIKPKQCFRYNRLKCRICERDDPAEKFKRNVRGRIHSALSRTTGKTMHTIKYLGATSAEYLQWILHNDQNYTLANRGKVWHIDHVIPLFHFDLANEEEQLIAFNWRNTMPLAAKENLSKNRKIVSSQIEHHYKHLLDYHKEKNMEMPQVFVDLFAKHLVAGIP